MPEFRTTASIPAGHPCLAGHFPDRPLVPAVLLLQSVVEALRPHCGGRAPSAVTAGKFLHPVLPEQLLELHLSYEPDTGRAHFRCVHQDRVVARGELRYDTVGEVRP